MIKQDMGHIVTVASLAGLTGSDRLVDYCSSKFAAVGFDESLRTELAVSLISFWSIIFYFNVALYTYFWEKIMSNRLMDGKESKRRYNLYYLLDIKNISR